MTDYKNRSDITAALNAMNGTTIAVKGALKALPDELHDAETVLAIIAGGYKDSTGIAAATDRRVLFIGKLGFSRTTEDFPYERISSVEASSGMALGSVTVYVSSQKAEIKNVSKQDAKSFADLVRAHIGPSSAPVAAAPAVSAADQIEKLAELHAQGVLSEAEFAAAKAKALGL